jgi:hypothetical protein
MKKNMLLLAAVVVALALQPGELMAGGCATVCRLLPAAPTSNPFVGSWTANFSKSKLHPSFRYQP